MLMLSS